MSDKDSVTAENLCPTCQTKLFFSADGRFRVCERCGYRQEVAPKRRSPRDLIDEQRISFEQNPTGFANVRTASVRGLLAQGVAAVKAGDVDEAYFYLAWVLRADAREKEQVQAWLWLSQVFEDPEDKRECLEQVLALDPTHGVARRGLAVLDGRINPDEIVDPDKLEQTIADTPQMAQAEQFTCPRCAGHMNYTPDGKALLCEFCSFRQELGADGLPQPPAQFGQGAFEQDFTAALATARGHLQPVQMRTFQCQSCAVDFVLAPETISLTCPYCDSVYVTETAESRDLIPPHALIPFAISEDDARRALAAWFRQHDLERPRVSPFVGIYLPLWTFDVGGELRWRGLVKKGDDWVPISGNYLSFYDDVLVPANQKLSGTFDECLDAFDLGQLVAYDARYLADWPAERYQIALSDASLVARKRVLKDLRRNASRFTHQTVHDLRLNSTGLVVESFKLVLLPLWVVHYKLEGKVYDVVINGQNGSVHGERPQGAVREFFARLLGE